MKVTDIVWNYMFISLNELFWESQLRHIPVFLKDLEKDRLGDFQCTPNGVNSILLGRNQNMTVRELTGVLLHEMCHQSAFQNYGIDIIPHGKEWQDAMRNVGFSGLINEYTNGLCRFSEEELCRIIARHDELIEQFGI